MSTLYVGNLPNEVTENEIRQLFSENSINCSGVLLKKGGYAFVDCPEQSLADRAIDKLNGTTFLGAPIVVEPSVGLSQKKRITELQTLKTPTRTANCITSELHLEEEMEADSLTNGYCGGQTKVMISNVASHVGLNDLEPLLSQYHIQNCEKVSSRDPQTQTILVTFESNDQAQQAVNELNGREFEGLFLKAELRNTGGSGGGGMGGGSGDDKRGPRGGGRPRGPAGFPLGGGAGAGAGARQTDFPLRILVQSDMVGAIIGRQGSTIRQITQQSRARVDVHRKDNVGSLEKAITIYGNPENCTNACKRILEVMKQEATTNNKGEITLKVLAHNNLIGRIIGKAGNTIKRIMQETDTKITVSSINDINSFNLERIITVKGSIDNMSKAESMISSKLRQSYENDLQAMAVQGCNFLLARSKVSLLTKNDKCCTPLEA